MRKYKTEKEVIEYMQAGWKLEERTNFNGGKVLSYWLGKKNQKSEQCVTIKTRNALVEKGLVCKNNQLVKGASGQTGT